MNLLPVRRDTVAIRGENTEETIALQVSAAYGALPLVLGTLTDSQKRHILESAIMYYLLGTTSEWTAIGAIARSQNAAINRITL